MIQEIDRMVRVELGLEEPQIPDWDYTGGHYPRDLEHDMWHAYRDHGVLYTDYMAQPEEWRTMINTREAIYRTKRQQAMPEYEQMLENKAKR